METNTFEAPVSIIVGLGFPTQISSVAEAYALLSEWPHGRRDSTHAVALKTCRAALDGMIEAETARSTFVAFARKTGILLPENQSVIAASETGAIGAGISARGP